jgi:hypothetical protein
LGIKIINKDTRKKSTFLRSHKARLAICNIVQGVKYCITWMECDVKGNKTKEKD